MVTLFEIMPVLVMAAMIVFIPILGDGPGAGEAVRRTKSGR